MKKVGFIVGIIIMIGVFIFANKLYYPPLPIENISAKDAIEQLNNSDSKIVKIAEEGDFIWYITRSENEGISIADEKIKQMFTAKGWKFKEKLGSGLVFEKDDENLIPTTQMWTKKYVLVKVPSKFKNL